MTSRKMHNLDDLICAILFVVIVLGVLFFMSSCVFVGTPPISGTVTDQPTITTTPTILPTVTTTPQPTSTVIVIISKGKKP